MKEAKCDASTWGAGVTRDDLIELAVEVNRRYLGGFMVDDNGPRPLRNIEMYACRKWLQARLEDPNLMPQIAAMWGMLNRKEPAHATD